MRISSRGFPLLLAAAMGLVALAPACKSSALSAASSIEGSTDALTEDHDEGSISWVVSPEGEVKALVKSNASAAPKTVSGALTWRAAGAAPATIPLTSKSGVLVATGPKLQDEITEVEYSVVVDGKPWRGTLHLPRGGTHELAEGAQLAAKAGAQAKGPHGGVVQIIGDDRAEVVADKDSGQIRVYLIDRDGKSGELEDRKVRVAVTGDSSEIVLLSPESSGKYFVGTLHGRAAPVKLTIAITLRGSTRVCLVGWAPRAHVVVGSRAPRTEIWINAGWGRGREVALGHDHHEHVDIKIHDKGKGHGKTKIQIKIH